MTSTKHYVPARLPAAYAGARGPSTSGRPPSDEIDVGSLSQVRPCARRTATFGYRHYSYASGAAE